MNLTDDEFSALHGLVYNECYYGDDDIAYGNGLGAIVIRALMAKLDDEDIRRNRVNDPKIFESLTRDYRVKAQDTEVMVLWRSRDERVFDCDSLFEPEVAIEMAHELIRAANEAASRRDHAQE